VRNNQLKREQVASKLVRMAKRLLTATWGFHVDIKGQGVDWKQLVGGLKDGNPHIDIASSVERAIERNKRRLDMGKTIDVERTFRITVKKSDEDTYEVWLD
jgi:hypothetical protein